MSLAGGHDLVGILIHKTYIIHF